MFSITVSLFSVIVPLFSLGYSCTKHQGGTLGNIESRPDFYGPVSQILFSLSLRCEGVNAAIGTHVENKLSSLAFITEVKKRKLNIKQNTQVPSDITML